MVESETISFSVKELTLIISTLEYYDGKTRKNKKKHSYLLKI